MSLWYYIYVSNICKILLLGRIYDKRCFLGDHRAIGN